VLHRLSLQHPVRRALQSQNPVINCRRLSRQGGWRAAGWPRSPERRRQLLLKRCASGGVTSSAWPYAKAVGAMALSADHALQQVQDAGARRIIDNLTTQHCLNHHAPCRRTGTKLYGDLHEFVEHIERHGLHSPLVHEQSWLLQDSCHKGLSGPAGSCLALQATSKSPLPPRMPAPARPLLVSSKFTGIHHSSPQLAIINCCRAGAMAVLSARSALGVTCAAGGGRWTDPLPTLGCRHHAPAASGAQRRPRTPSCGGGQHCRRSQCVGGHVRVQSLMPSQVPVGSSGRLGCNAVTWLETRGGFVKKRSSTQLSSSLC
jgi:hypothetical protein